MAKIINQYEMNKQWQLDTNPFNWFRVGEGESSQMVYIGGTVYRYNEAWSFEKVGLLQWVEPNYINRGTVQSAKIPTQKEVSEFANHWNQMNSEDVLWWKKHLNLSIQPKTI